MSDGHSSDLRRGFVDLWAPLTSTLTFLKGDKEHVASMFRDFRSSFLEEEFGSPLAIRKITGDHDALMNQLQPLSTTGARITLFMSVRSAEPWTLVLGNRYLGTDQNFFAPSAHRGIFSVTICSSPSRKTEPVQYGIYAFKVACREPAWTGAMMSRSIGIAQFESLRRWDFIDHGESLPFEDLERYKARRVRDRFGPDLLVRYAAEYGLRPFDDDFYAPDGRGIIVERTDPPPPDSWETDLEGARSGRPLEEIAWHPDQRPARFRS